MELFVLSVHAAQDELLHQLHWGEWRTEDTSLAEKFIKRLKIVKLLLTPFQHAAKTICHLPETPPPLSTPQFSSIKNVPTSKLSLTIHWPWLNAKMTTVRLFGWLTILSCFQTWTPENVLTMTLSRLCLSHMNNAAGNSLVRHVRKTTTKSAERSAEGWNSLQEALHNIQEALHDLQEALHDLQTLASSTKGSRISLTPFNQSDGSELIQPAKLLKTSLLYDEPHHYVTAKVDVSMPQLRKWTHELALMSIIHLNHSLNACSLCSPSCADTHQHSWRSPHNDQCFF